jgi:hypothetical protein
MSLRGTVTDLPSKANGYFARVETDGPPHLRVLFLRPNDFNEPVALGDTVSLTYVNGPHRGLYVAMKETA